MCAAGSLKHIGNTKGGMGMNRVAAGLNCIEADMAVMMQRYGGMLLGMCAKILRDFDLAEDAVQETFLKAYLKRNSFRGENERSEKAWLMQIAVNVCRDHLRSRWFRTVDRSISVEELSLPVMMDEEALALKWAVGSLPQKYQEIISMYYYRDMPVDEIAMMGGKSPSVVYRRLVKARKQLKMILQ